MEKFLTTLRLYSTQVMLVVASLNTAMVNMDDVPWWFVLLVNAAGVIAHNIARAAPQPVVAAKLATLK